MSSELRNESEAVIASFERPSFNGFIDTQTVDRTVDRTVDKTFDSSEMPTLTAREDALLRLLASNPRMTQQQWADQLGLTERGVRYLTNKLQKMGRLQRQGGKRAGHWVLVHAPNDGATS